LADAVAVETSGSIGIIIGVIVGVIALVLALVFMRRRRRLNDNKAPKGGEATKAAKTAEAQKAEAERDENRANLISSKRPQLLFASSKKLMREDRTSVRLPTNDRRSHKDLMDERVSKIGPGRTRTPSFASEGTIDIDKSSASAKTNNLVASSIASATARGVAKVAALNDMVVQASRASKIKLIPWNELEMTEKLGEGTFGTVHACLLNATPCAVKQLREDKESSVQLLADMLREHDAMTGLRHPNVALMLGIATDHVRRVGIVLERLEISLLELLHGGSEYQEYRTWRASLLSIASDVAKGIAYLHFNNVLHRNLKPGNVLLSDSWVAKVADFGSSAIGKISATASGGNEAHHGTPPYMAPEVAHGEINQTAALDVWSFGCLLVHMGTLRPPYYALNCKTAMDIVRVVQRGDVSPVQVLLDDSERREYRCPASIVALAKNCCHREPTQRPDMSAIAGALVSPAIQTSIQKGATDARPLVRLQRSRASVEGEGTFDTSKATYDASVAGSSRSKFRSLSARLARASNANLDARSQSQRSQGSLCSSARGALEHAAESARCAHEGAERSPLTSKRRTSTIGSSAAHLSSTPPQELPRPRRRAASASAAVPSSAAPKCAAAPLGSPAAFSIRFTLAQKVARIKEELSLDPSLL
jgi:serine/threonine protein kinase